MQVRTMAGESKEGAAIFLISIFILSLQGLSVGAQGSIRAEIIVRIFRMRSRTKDFTTVNRYICPPSLCKPANETDPQKEPRKPKGTGGTVFYQGDIVLDAGMDRYIYPDSQKIQRRSKRATMKKRNRLWEDGEVVYRMGKAISSEAKHVLERAMRHIMKRTCITFRERKSKDKNFIRFISEPGCWSQIGRVGGVQLVSIGKGCENLGTAVHEIVHALGIWHEQARPDRDKFVDILEENISDRFKPDFEVVSKRVSTSRGYPYDYGSLMHYSKYAFTRNGEVTIKVKGIGEELGLKIGQRRGLSTIDISQLRDMYKCNLKEDINQTVCLKGWKKISTTCYKFFTEPKAQFGPAFRTCQGLKSHLVTLDNSHEEKLLTKYLNRKFNTTGTWRTAGRKVNDYMMWYVGEASARNITDYSNWAEDQPGSYSSMVLRRVGKSQQFKWYGEWVGSAKQKPDYEHAFICERPARRKCLPGRYSDGRDYRGDLDHTREGHTCQKWSEKYPHNHTLVEEAKRGKRYGTGENPWNGLGDHNKCRNPSGLRRNRPWCFTTKRRIEWEYCDVSICAKSVQEFQNRFTRRQGIRPSGKGSAGARKGKT